MRTTESMSMAARQGSTPPTWLGRSRWQLLVDVVGGWRQNIDKIVQFLQLASAFFRPGLVRKRLDRLRELGHIDVVPNMPQLLVAARDQMMVSATEETKLFYKSQGIPWVFHNLRRFLSGPATVLDPMGLFSPRDAIIHHVLQTFHRHPVYDLVLLRAYESGVEEMERQARQIVEGHHPHQRALTSLIEDGSYHQRLIGEIAAFRQNFHISARPVPPGLLDDPAMMAAMDQFKDIRGYASHASRLRVGFRQVLLAWLLVAFDETLGGVLGIKLGPKQVRLEACERAIVAAHT